MMDREELQSLSLDELRALAEQHGVAHANHLAKSQIVDRLSRQQRRWGIRRSAGQASQKLGQKVGDLLHRVDQALGKSIQRMVIARGKAPWSARGASATSIKASATTSSATAPLASDDRPGGVAPRTAFGLTGSAAGSGSDKEIVYPAPGERGAHPSSFGAVRGPKNAAGSVDHAHLSAEMAQTYAAEGRRDQAAEIYRLLLEERPSDPELLRRLEELTQSVGGEERSRAARPKLAPSSTGPHSEPFGMLDLEELPETYGVNEVEVLYKDPWWSFVYWEVTEEGIEAARLQLGPAAASCRLVLRLFTTQQSPGAASREVRDVPLTWNHGRRYLDIPKPGSYLRVAIGLLSAEGYFAPIAHSSLLRLPPPNPSPAQAVDWMQVMPQRGRGEQREHILIISRSVTHSERGLSWRVAAGIKTGAGRAGAGTLTESEGGDDDESATPWQHSPSSPSRGPGSGKTGGIGGSGSGGLG